jgi:hypothetical protein
MRNILGRFGFEIGYCGYWALPPNQNAGRDLTIAARLASPAMAEAYAGALLSRQPERKAAAPAAAPPAAAAQGKESD